MSEHQELIAAHELMIKQSKPINSYNIQLLLKSWFRKGNITFIQDLLDQIWIYYDILPIFKSFPLYHSNLTVEYNNNIASIANKSHDTYLRSCTFGEAIFPVKHRIYHFDIRVDIAGKIGVIFVPQGYSNVQQPPYCFDKCLSICDTNIWNSDWIHINKTTEWYHKSIFGEKDTILSVYIDGVSNILKIKYCPTGWVAYLRIPKYYNDQNKFGLGFVLYSGSELGEITQISVIKQEWM